MVRFGKFDPAVEPTGLWATDGSSSAVFES